MALEGVKIDDYEVKVVLLVKTSTRNSMASDALGVLVGLPKQAGGSNPPLSTRAHLRIGERGNNTFQKFKIYPFCANCGA